MSHTRQRWRLELGAEVHKDGVFFRVWAPKATQMEVVFENDLGAYPLRREENDYFTAFVPDITPGALYRYRIDGVHQYPDPCSRFQPHGPHGPSLIVDPFAFSWHDDAWPGIGMPGQVIYEMHIGTFTPTGTFDSAIPEFAELKHIGITTLEVMPVAEFSGRWNWGYDGVDLYAPTHNYGDADAFRRFVDAAHQIGLGVILGADLIYTPAPEPLLAPPSQGYWNLCSLLPLRDTGTSAGLVTTLVTVGQALLIPVMRTASIFQARVQRFLLHKYYQRIQNAERSTIRTVDV